MFLSVFFLCKSTTIREYYNNSNTYLHSKDTTNHSVKLPLTTTYSCQNICGPLSKCSITGEQCSADIDCYGCQKKYGKKYNSNNSNNSNNVVIGNDDAGKLTLGVTPTYSSLTNGYGTKQQIITTVLRNAIEHSHSHAQSNTTH
jgi:hypothetical protein